MGWLKTIINTLVGSLIALVLAAAFQAPLVDFFNRDRLTARFEAGPWIDKPKLKGDETRLNYSEDNSVASAIESFSDSLSDKNIDGRWYETGKLTLVNRSKKEITAIRINYIGTYTPDILVIPENRKDSYFIKSASDITLPDMKPGDKAVIFQWSTLTPVLVESSFNTYSSEGDFRIDFDFPTTISTSTAGQFVSFIFSYIWFIIIVLVIIIFFALIAQIDFLITYYKRLLSDDDIYLSERVRFEKDASKFSPDSNTLKSK